ncbi:polysaccharide biosynthesis tyrosine autokinase [Agromyces sp. CFH 90414]|uniref:non-specific protein-tyrosine kinase n=1 Tax=Agromyces agglutinans TaxID=2662258 RepID=A0A6I2FBL8_9MICO|nr:polysaccharide biosynthesis tyrosine autokinase [Agromyces agglutinans]MRG60100.1 polysaccharide biosynthesis tyrosine autokinase [Agromyces agglutinans]
MTLHDYITALRKHWIAIVLLALVGAGAAYGYSRVLPEQYRAEASVMVIPVRGDNTSELVQGANYVQNLVQTYTILATSPRVLQAVIDDVGLDETANRLARRVSAEAPLNTVVIDLSATDTSPEGAQRTADAMAEQLAVAVADLSPEGADSRPAVRVETIAPARVPTVPVAPNTRLNVILGFVAGAALGVAYALIRTKFGTRLASVDDIADVTDLPVIGSVAGTGDQRPIAAHLRSNPAGRVAESLRHVTAGFKFVDLDHSHRVILVTSGSSAEGKTSLALGLALSLAEIGHRTLYVEADLRRPSASQYTGLDSQVGLTTVTIGSTTLDEAVQGWAHADLDLLLSGELPPNTVQLLSSDRLQQVLVTAREAYDYVIVDSAPVLTVSDALWVAPATDGVLFVVRANRTRRSELERSLRALESTHIPVLGLVLNDVRLPARSPYYSTEPAERKASRLRPRRLTSPSATDG